MPNKLILFVVCVMCVWSSSLIFIIYIHSANECLKTSLNMIGQGLEEITKYDLNISQTFSFIKQRFDKNMSENDLDKCSQKRIELSPKSLPITGLASFPGSGNTWTRYLIQQMSGLATSSCYCDDVLRANGFPFECFTDKSKTLVVKTHEMTEVLHNKFDQVVLLIRNPYDAIMSYVNFNQSGHTGRPPKSVLMQAVEDLFNSSMLSYVTLTTEVAWIYRGPVHIVQYEKLKTDMSDTLWKLAEFLHVNVTQRDIDCTVKLQEGNFHRKTSEKEHLQLLKEVYDKDKLLKMKEAADKTEELIKEAYGIDIDVGGATERLLFDDGFTDKLHTEDKQRVRENDRENLNIV